MGLEVARDVGKQAAENGGLEGIDEVEEPDAVARRWLALISVLVEPRGKRGTGEQQRT